MAPAAKRTPRVFLLRQVGRLLARSAAIFLLFATPSAPATVYCYYVAQVGPEMVCSECVSTSCGACLSQYNFSTPEIIICTPFQYVSVAPEGQSGMDTYGFESRSCFSYWTCTPPVSCTGQDCHRGFFIDNSEEWGWQDYLTGQACTP